MTARWQQLQKLICCYLLLPLAVYGSSFQQADVNQDILSPRVFSDSHNQNAHQHRKLICLKLHVSFTLQFYLVEEKFDL